MVDMVSGTASARSQRLRRTDRLRTSKDYRRVNRTGRRRAGPHFVAQTAPAFGASRGGLGLVVSRRAGNAVERNHVKRRVREWFRMNRELIGDGIDLVVIARAGAARLDSDAISDELSTLVAG